MRPLSPGRYDGAGTPSPFTLKKLTCRCSVSACADISSAIAAFFYIRVIVLMFFSEPKADGPTVAVPSPLTMTTIAVGVAVTLVLGLAPQYFLDLAGQAGVFVR